LAQSLYATHIRAGEITSRRTSGTALSYCFTVTLYTDDTSPVESFELVLNFGDGTTGTASRISQVRLGNLTTVNVYQVCHTYAGPGVYRVFFVEENRNAGVLNMSQSVNTPFSVESQVVIDPFLGINNSPILLAQPIDLACIGQRYTHNPAAFDPDGDSLSYRLTIPKRSGTETVVGYLDPADVTPRGSSEAGGAPSFSINPITGTITWDAPNVPGEYNIAFVIEEWRGGVRVGFVVRDMQITVTDCRNRRPEVIVPNDICVPAGTRIEEIIRAVDPDGNRIRLTSEGGVYGSLIQPTRATFTPGATQPQNSPASATFVWQTNCVHIRQEPYQIVFKAEDEPPPPQSRRLADIKPWRITVVGPAPTNLTATPSGRNMILNWDSYSCTNASELIIWRREGCSDWIPADCEIGVPPERGYVEIGRVSANATTFTDLTTLKRGVRYSYRVSATFPAPAGGESYASNEACMAVAIEAPVITQASVIQTGTNDGRINIQWIRPPEGTFTPPYRYELYRAEGLTGTDYALIQTINDPTGAQANFNFEDTGLNTQALAYNYQVRFFSNAGTVEEASDPASSVRLEVAPAPSSLRLVWRYEVPWSNVGTRHRIFRRIGGNFVQIDEVEARAGNEQVYADFGTFGDERLINGQQYCYRVETIGTFSNPVIPVDPILNFSQEFCAIAVDTTAPCPPILALDSILCEGFNERTPLRNRLSWQKVVTGTVGGRQCADDIDFYTLYYSPTEPGEFVELVRTRDLNFIHDNISSLAGCYEVTATDLSGNESRRSNRVCQDNCFQYELPNVVTPNDDQTNERFRPFPGYRFVESVRTTIYNRWGSVVFTTNDIEINWDGKTNNGTPVAPGAYFYSAVVRFITLRPEQAVQELKGWIELIR
jgi:gliding motility-associated-like protein